MMDGARRKELASLAGEEGYTEKPLAAMHPFISEAPVQIVVSTSEKIYKDRYQEPARRNRARLTWNGQRRTGIPMPAAR